jgi:hypothetical protein
MGVSARAGHQRLGHIAGRSSDKRPDGVNSVVKIDNRAARRFHDAMRDLTRIAGGDFEKVIKHEVGAVLTNAVRNTKKATVKTIKANHDGQPGANYSIAYSGPESRTGRQYTPAEVRRAQERAAAARARGRRGKALYYLKGSRQPHRYPNWAWSKLEELRAASLPKKQKARALAASMWVKIADQLGVTVKAPAYIRNAAHAKKGPMIEMTEVSQSNEGKKYALGFVNNLTHTNKWAGAGSAFRAALNARANYFSASVKLEAKGVVKKALDRYPGLAAVT